LKPVDEAEESELSENHMSKKIEFQALDAESQKILCDLEKNLKRQKKQLTRIAKGKGTNIMNRITSNFPRGDLLK
jgi:hypothetical protein